MDPNVDELKKKGNDAMKAGDFDGALQCYTDAIAIDPENHVLFSNRCAAYMKEEKYDEALQDAEKTIKIKSDWVKGYSRKGSALFKLNRLKEAEDAYQEGLKLEPENALLKDGLSEVLSRQNAVPNPFAGPSVEAKLRSSPKTSAYMNDPSFMTTLRSLQANPNNLMKHMQDSRVMEALGVLLGVDIGSMGSANSDPLVQEGNKGPSSADLTSDNKATPMETERPEEPQKGDPDAKRKQEALEEKDKGNDAYKAKDFETAVKHYDKAFELDPSNVTFLTNKAAVYFEQKEYDKCVELCEEAVEKGRDVRADFKIIAKALARIGNVYVKQDKWELAVKYFDKSLADHRNPDIVNKKREAQKKLKDQECMAYLDKDKSLEAKEMGNQSFKKGDFPSAIKSYTEAIKRDPNNAILYSNRAACYQKLLEFPMALKDCEECIKLDPKFVKGHIRRAHALIAMKDNVKAMQSFQAAVDIDPDNAEARAGLSRCMTQDDPEARRKAAMHDPEVQQILNDPAMQMILQQMQSNPEALRDHLKNPNIASKIQRLIEAGFISMR